MADTSNLSKFLSDVADAIRTKKETTDTIPAKDFDTEILSIEAGINTSDATAAADNIESGYTAYVNGKKINGSITTSTHAIITAGSDATITDTGEALNVDRGYGKKLVLNSEQQLRSTIPYATLASVGEITADKIVKGETIFGVAGTAEGGAVVEDTDEPKHYTFKTTEEADVFSNYKLYDTVSIVGSRRQPFDISTFTTNIARKNYAQNFNVGVLYCNDTVVLPAPIEVDEKVTFTTTSGSKSYENEFSIKLTSTECVICFNWYKLMGLDSGYAYWSSTDGITYTFLGMKDDVTDTEYLTTTKFDLKTLSTSTTLGENAITLLNTAAEEFADKATIGYFLYHCIPDCFQGFWQVDANISTIDYTQFHSVDLQNSIFTSSTTTDTTTYTLKYKRDVYDITYFADIFSKIPIPSNNATAVFVCDEGDELYMVQSGGIVYAYSENKYYMITHSDNTSYWKYTRSTDTMVSYTIPSNKIIKEIPTTANFFGVGVETETHAMGNYTGAINLYVRDVATSETSVTIPTKSMSGILISRNDFGLTATNNDVMLNKSVITNNGVVIGTKRLAQITGDEEVQAITALSEVVGGE